MLPTVSTLPAPALDVLPRLPKSWSALSWRQLCDCWQCKMQYGGNADVARAAALLSLCGLEPSRQNREAHDTVTGEAVYTLQDGDGRPFTVTPRELSQMARQALPWFDYPYGNPGKEAVKDDGGKVIEEAIAPVPGYVNPDFRDAMVLPEETVVVGGHRIMTGTEWQAMSKKPRNVHHFSLPHVACCNLTWQQYRTLQSIAPQLFHDGTSDDDVIDLQAQFMAYCLVPARQPSVTADPFAPPHDFTYDSERAEQAVAFWKKLLASEEKMASTLFHILFQVYQTALSYYAKVFPLLFNGSGKHDPLQDALTGETRTLNAVMKYQGYTRPEEVYAEDMPNILSTLNTMAEEARQIEQMNAKIKRKR